MKLNGTGVSKGNISGKIKVISNEKEIDFPKGSILVARMTNPLMLPLMHKAKAIICEIGGITSHAAIVSRELGIPCIVGVKNATKKLKDGMEVIIDGEQGTILLK